MSDLRATAVPPTPTDDTTRSRRVAAVSLIAAAVLAAAGFTALGSVFDYPHVLEAPTDAILARYRDHQLAVSGWFLVLVVGAALLAPAAVALGRLAGGRPGRWIAGLGVAAAVVQAIGLSRWVLAVPFLSRDATDPATAAGARHTFELLHLWLGQVLGETVGYVLTAAFTVLVAATVVRGTRWLALLGYAAAVLVVTGVLVPLGVEVAVLTNFAGYVLWCVWLVAVAAVLWRRTRSPARVDAGVNATTAATAPRSSGRR